MTYDTETFRRTIGQMSNEELLKRLHLDMFTEEARVVAEEEAASRNLVVDGTKVEREIAEEKAAVQQHRSRKYVNTLTVLAGAAGATNLGILGGLAFLVPGRWVAKYLDSRLSSFPARFLGGIGVLLVGIPVAKILQLALAAVLGWQPT